MIMIDGFKCFNVCVPIHKLISNELLSFAQNLIINTGEIKEDKYCEYNGLYFRIKGNNCRLWGSLHKFKNNGEHNYDDLNYAELTATLDILSAITGIIDSKTNVNMLEFGVNIELPFPVRKLLDSIIMYKGERFNRSTHKDGDVLECQLNKYLLKIYDKSLQYRLDKNIVRLEIKACKMQFFKDLNIKLRTLSDLYRQNSFNRLGDVLTDYLDELLIVDDDSVNEENFTRAERKLYNFGLFQRNWEKLKPKSEDFDEGSKDEKYKRQRKAYYKKLNAFKSLIAQHCNIKETVMNLVKIKVDELRTNSPLN